MAGESPVLTRVRAAVSLLDDEALAALASKGLVRRARNDLQSSPPKLIEPGDDKVRLQVEEYTVELAEIATQFGCTCPATGACRHIVTAILFLRETSAAAPPANQRTPSTAADEVLAVTDEALEKWAGKALIRRAIQILANDVRSEFEDAQTLVIRFSDWNVTCRWIPGYELSGMICSCHAAGACVHRVAAVMAFQAARGRRQIVSTPTALDASSGAPRTRLEVLESIGSVLRERVSLGLSRLSSSTEARLRTLAVSRMASICRDSSECCTRWLTRSLCGSGGTPRPRPATCLQPRPESRHCDGAREPFCRTGGRPPLALRQGRRHRFRRHGRPPMADAQRLLRRDRLLLGPVSESVGDLDRIPPGGSGRVRPDFPLSSRWAVGRLRFAVASQPACDAAAAGVAKQGGPTVGTDRHSLRDVRKSDSSQMPSPITAWSELAERAGRLFAGGLQTRAEQDEIVFLRPERWGPAAFDTVRQVLVQPVFDVVGRAAPSRHSALQADRERNSHS